MIAADKKKLTNRQQEILDFIVECIEHQNNAPTRNEIAAHFGFKSVNAAEDHLKSLHKKGHINLQAGTSRGIRLNQDAENRRLKNNGLAVIGEVAAGAPIFAEQNIHHYLRVDQGLFTQKADFLLTVNGDSMIDIGIYDHDLVAIKKTTHVKENDIVVARLENDVTVKRYQRQGDIIKLIAENKDYEPIIIDLRSQNFDIEGLVVGLIRRWL